MKKFNIDKTITKILAIILIISILATIYIIVVPQQGEKFTEFYILGPDEKAGGYPTNLTLGESGNVIVGVVNHEYTTTTYKLMITLNNKTLKDENITLANNEKREIPFKFTAARTGVNQELKFLLYKLPDNSTVYRSLHLFVSVE
ncbi:MAG: DUF1616 domain-containing protein [Methanobacterium sp.]|uniref:DUF1616 domain-containing protein n=1 Tax=Methanobacterium sp. TaxID=2164 RepID=UPI003D65059A|nr:DUF1616 domain-containing protein [Methanobacterium sp.]